MEVIVLEKRVVKYIPLFSTFFFYSKISKFSLYRHLNLPNNNSKILRYFQNGSKARYYPYFTGNLQTPLTRQ